MVYLVEVSFQSGFSFVFTTSAAIIINQVYLHGHFWAQRVSKTF